MSSKAESLLPLASQLADELRSPAALVQRNTFLGVVARFQRDGDVERLRTMVTLLAQGSGGHTERSGSYGEQVAHTARVLDGFLRLHPEMEIRDLQSLLGWAGRDLEIKAKLGGPVPAKGGGGGRLPGKPARREERRLRQPPRRPPAKLSALNGQARSALEALKAKLKKPENGDPD
jgi:hypothetical protein